MNFDATRLRRADQIVGGSAIAFFIFLFFLLWYGGNASTPLGGTSGGENGWHAFTNSRWIWLIAIVVALVAVARRAGALSFETPVSFSAIVGFFGALSTVLILYRIVHHPHASASATIAGVRYSASYGIKIGIWLGLIACVALTYGAYLAMRDDGISLADVREHAGGALGNLSQQGPVSGGGGGDATDTDRTRIRDIPERPEAPAESASPPIPPPASDPPPAS